jgi:hypothetical protein
MSLLQGEAPALSADVSWLHDLSPVSAKIVHHNLLAFQAEANLLPNLAAEAELPLNYHAMEHLRWEAALSQQRTVGLARASYFLGRVINGAMPIQSLINQPPEGLTPRQVARIEQRGQAVAGESGLYLRMLADLLCLKDDADSSDDYIELSPRQPQDALKTGHNYAPAARSGNYQTSFCFRADDCFVGVGFRGRGLKPITVDDQVVALQKSLQDHSAILVRPARLNGVRLPVGSLMTVGQPDSQQPLFAFGRLSSFCFPTTRQAARAMPSLVTALQQSEGSLFDDELANFNQLVGRPQQETDPLVLADAEQWQAAQYSADRVLNAVHLALQARRRRAQNEAINPRGCGRALAKAAQIRLDFTDRFGRQALVAADHLLLDPVADQLQQIATSK